MTIESHGKKVRKKAHTGFTSCMSFYCCKKRPPLSLGRGLHGETIQRIFPLFVLYSKSEQMSRENYTFSRISTILFTAIFGDSTIMSEPKESISFIRISRSML